LKVIYVRVVTRVANCSFHTSQVDTWVGQMQFVRLPQVVLTQSKSGFHFQTL
jgi:hypothetical protein